MDTVRDILDRKGRQVWAISPDEPVYRALEMMADKRIGALLVLNRTKLIGVVSERDYARKVILAGKSSKETPVRDIMTSKVYYVTPAQRLDECMALMTDKAVRHLPVMDDGRLGGVVSIGDVVKAVISHQEFVIEQLEQFITGR
jgi:CBS domain-containing protein